MYIKNAFLASLLFCLLIPSGGLAGEAGFPLRFDLSLIRQELVAQMFTEPGERAVVFDDAKGCSWLYLHEPKIDAVEERLRVLCRADAGLGVFMNDQCLGPTPWKGFVELTDEMTYDNATNTLVLTTVRIALFDENMKPYRAGTGIVNFVRKSMRDRSENNTLSFAPLIENLRLLLPLAVSWSEASIQRFCASLKIRRPSLQDNSLVLNVSFDAPERAEAVQASSEPMLQQGELERFRKGLDQFDAFLTFIIKGFARQGKAALQTELFAVLFDTRYELVEALSSGWQGAEDPVRILFLRTWARLAPLVKELLRDQTGQAALQYASFISAADALAALDALGPGMGIDISADGLRRLARLIDPKTIADPLYYSTDIDPELRKLIGLGPPLPAPDIAPEVDMHAPGDNASAFLKQGVTTLLALAGSLSASDAVAETGDCGIGRLKRWVPERDELEAYLALVRSMLEQAADQTLANNALDKAYHPLYRDLVPAIAWQESCWRQFIKRNGSLVPLQSAIGSVGIMQINLNVWRGIYDGKGLLGDIVYNTRAGCEISLMYLRDYAIAKGEHLRPGGPENLPRAAYAVYNGGPGQLARYRTASTKDALKKIDSLFFEKYSAVRQGRIMEVIQCY